MKVSTRTRRGARIISVALAAVLILSACEPIYTLAAADHRDATPNTRPWWCDSTGGGHGDHTPPDPDPYAGITKGELSWDDCLTNSVWFDAAVDYAQQWPTAGSAVADGWFRVVPYAAGMGTHHRRADSANIDDVFKGYEPEFLMYDGNGSGAELTGMAWWVQSEGAPPTVSRVTTTGGTSTSTCVCHSPAPGSARGSPPSSAPRWAACTTPTTIGGWPTRGSCPTGS